MIVRPAPYFRVQFFDELPLWYVAVVLYRVLNFCNMLFYRLFAWFDVGFEAKWCSIAIFPRVGFSSRELSYGPSQKVKSDCALIVSQRVSHSCFTWLQFLAHVLYPRFKHFLSLLHPFFRGMKKSGKEVTLL